MISSKGFYTDQFDYVLDHRLNVIPLRLLLLGCGFAAYAWINVFIWHDAI